MNQLHLVFIQKLIYAHLSIQMCTMEAKIVASINQIAMASLYNTVVHAVRIQTIFCVPLILDVMIVSLE